MYIPGRNPAIEALRSPIQVNKIYLQEGINQDEKISQIIGLAQQKGISIIDSSRKQLSKMSGDDPHQGVILDVELIANKLTKDVVNFNQGLYIYIREAQYEHNVGAIIRTAEVAGAAGVILNPRQELTPTIARISMGGVFHVPLYSSSLFPTMKLMKKQAYLVYALERGGQNTIYDVELSGNILLVVGGEDRSISPEVAAKCDDVLTIPQFGKVNSLNMSVAAAISIYEYVRNERQL
jgi:23S rRNA (guanosine2251-2'-O)-methyltransferase